MSAMRRQRLTRWTATTQHRHRQPPDLFGVITANIDLDASVREAMDQLVRRDSLVLVTES